MRKGLYRGGNSRWASGGRLGRNAIECAMGLAIAGVLSVPDGGDGGVLQQAD